MIDQIIIAITGGASSWLIHSRSTKTRRLACTFALIGQPFWFYAAWKANQWGIFAMDFVYTAAWLRGTILNWVTLEGD